MWGTACLCHRDTVCGAQPAYVTGILKDLTLIPASLLPSSLPRLCARCGLGTVALALALGKPCTTEPSNCSVVVL